ncbi:MAG TPA: type II secretion system F family protein [Gemmatimonadaceae bacterium]|nr:type II secretion system F family protein [Gemmatimonadaceae bacterium]
MTVAAPSRTSTTATTTYTYRAVQLDGTTVTGTIEAPTEARALATLTERALFPLLLHSAPPLLGRTTAVPVADLALGLRVLANLLESGLPVGKTLSAFAELAPASWHPGLPAVRDAVRDGATLTAALAASPLDVPPVVLGMLHAGEVGTGVGPAVRRAAELMERTAATRSAIRNALAYPVILALAGSASLTLLVGVVLPKFAAVLNDLGQQLPHTTQLVLHGSAMLRALALPGLCLTIAVVLGWRLWTGTLAGRLQWHRALRRISIVGSIRRSAATARTAAAMASLLESGVPVATALTHASRAAGDAAVEQAVLDARTRITHGERPSHAIEQTGALTPTAVRLLRAGEESGRLAQMFAHVATIEQERAEQAVRSAVRLLEPALILLFGGVVAFVAAALLQAVYSVRPTH